MLWPRWIWLRALGLIFLSAFYSLAFQIEGLNGPRGILPAGDYLRELHAAAGIVKALWIAPTLFWLGSTDGALLVVVLLGAAASVLLTLNVAPRASLGVAFVCFLFFVAAAQDFASYQSDGMLLEAAFISLFVAPGGLRPGLGADQPPWRLAMFLLVWEWLPHGFHAGTVVLVFAIELVLVWLAFLPRRFRLACFFLVSPFQAAIILTANYAFLNYLVLSLGVWLLDDPLLQTIGLPPPRPLSRPWTKKNYFLFFGRAPDWAARGVLGWVLYSTVVLAPGLSARRPRALLFPAELLEPFRIGNRYGLFAVMTEDRFEIEFQGSRDGQTWTPYPFRYKPQDPQRAPGIYAPELRRADGEIRAVRMP